MGLLRSSPVGSWMCQPEVEREVCPLGKNANVEPAHVHVYFMLN